MAPPEAIGPYQVVRLLGSGAMGQVFEARREGLGRPLAVKLLPTLLADAETQARFAREGQLLARIRHKNVVPVLDAGASPAGAWLAMELIEGEELKRPADRRELDHRRAAELVAELAEGVAALHAEGILHRDLKPANVILRPEGTPVIIDFGLARGPDVERLTRSGDMLGTPAYMAPEQASGRACTPASDVYALGAVLYHLLCGRPPFVGKSAIEVFRGILERDPPDPATLGVELDPALWELLRRTLAKDPAHRPPSASALREQLRAWIAATGTRRLAKRSRWPLLLAGAAALGAVAAGLVLLRSGEGHAAGPEAETLPSLAWVGTPPQRAPGTRVGLTVLPRGVGLLDLEAPGHRARVRPDVHHWFEVELQPGDNPIVVSLRDAQGREAPPLELTVHAAGLPPWFGELDEASRPPVPLPDGVECTDRAGVYRNRADGSELVWIPAGEVLVTPPGFEPVREAVEGFYLGRTEVTVGQFKAFLARYEEEHPPKEEGPDHPISQLRDDQPAAFVSWDEADRYCTSSGLRLPRALEWELARANPAPGLEALTSGVDEWALDLHPRDMLNQTEAYRAQHRTLNGAGKGRDRSRQNAQIGFRVARSARD